MWGNRSAMWREIPSSSNFGRKRKEFEGKPDRVVENPLAWWKSEPEFVCRYPLVQHLWSIPASSASSARLFSYLGHLLTRAPQRSPRTLKHLALLRDYQKQPTYDFEQLLKAVNEEKEAILSEEIQLYVQRPGWEAGRTVQPPKAGLDVGRSGVLDMSASRAAALPASARGSWQ